MHIPPTPSQLILLYSVSQKVVDQDLWFKNITTNDTQNPSEAHIKQAFFPAFLKKKIETN